MPTAQTLKASTANAPADGASAPVAESAAPRPGRHRLGKEPYARVTFSVSPSLMDAVEMLGGHGFGRKATVVRVFVEAGIASGGLERIVAEAASAGVARGDAREAATGGVDPHSAGREGADARVRRSVAGGGVSDESADDVESRSIVHDGMDGVKSRSIVADSAARDGGEAARAVSAAVAGSGAERPRKPGPGRRRVGREAMVLVSTLMEPATLARIEAVADRTSLPRGQVLRRLAEMGLEHILVTGYRAVAEESAPCM